MSKYGFLDVLEEEMDKVFPFDFEINWDKKNHAVEVAFLLEAQNTGGLHWLMKLAKNLMRIFLKKPLSSTIQPSRMWTKMPI